MNDTHKVMSSVLSCVKISLSDMKFLHPNIAVFRLHLLNYCPYLVSFPGYSMQEVNLKQLGHSYGTACLNSTHWEGAGQSATHRQPDLCKPCYW